MPVKFKNKLFKNSYSKIHNMLCCNNWPHLNPVIIGPTHITQIEVCEGVMSTPVTTIHDIIEGFHL